MTGMILDPFEKVKEEGELRMFASSSLPERHQFGLEHVWYENLLLFQS